MNWSLTLFIRIDIGQNNCMITTTFFHYHYFVLLEIHLFVIAIMATRLFDQGSLEFVFKTFDCINSYWIFYVRMVEAMLFLWIFTFDRMPHFNLHYGQIFIHSIIPNNNNLTKFPNFLQYIGQWKFVLQTFNLPKIKWTSYCLRLTEQNFFLCITNLNINHLYMEKNTQWHNIHHNLVCKQ